ncbi:GNAT family N-acetyltransferase [Lactococcus lactis]|uniref:GNAT family N-acetyltransferase n=1 Tax=Lactococcus lactis TaxID=1358 RepID=UPI0021AEF7C1|nr:GNAT family N-acetyltransferase [Lactococcus lactis]MCT1186334.1 GNAT family N-acetyltransferase [Lactococcus lactis]MCT1189759.1 GNAT family N-acetyltransferase [Lactococcus lactis]
MIYMRKAGPKDLLSIMKIIEEARTFLADSGSDQWQNAYPAVFDIEEDFAKEQAYVLLVDDKIAGYCAIITGEEPAYTQITDGAWSNQNFDYVTIHRIALSNEFSGQSLTRYLFSNIFTLMLSKGYSDFRLDTHPVNKLMQHVFEREGFVKRGLVQFEGDRFAYQLELNK